MTEKLMPAVKTGARATLKMTYTFIKPGIYFLTLRAASKRQGDTIFYSPAFKTLIA